MMNSSPRDPRDPPDADDELPEALRFQLRALRRDETPARELWPELVARIGTARMATAPVRRRWATPVALAATLAIALGAAGLWRGVMPPTSSPTSEAASDTLVQREAAGMARQYNAAFSEVATASSAPDLQPAFDELDRNASLILDALAHDPDSRLLLEQLRRTYAHRLALAQRAAYS